MNTVEGVFRILDRASPTLDRIERKAGGLDRTMERIGVRMDEFSAKTQKDMRVAEDGMDKFARSTEKASGKVSGSMTVMERSVASATSGAQRDIGELQTQLATLDAQTANPSIDIDTAGPLAQIALIRKELRSLNDERINIGGSGKGGVISSAVAQAVAPQQKKGGFMRQAFNWAKRTATDAAVRRAEQGIQGKVNSMITRVFTRGGGAKEIDETAESVDRLTRKVAKSGGVFGSVGERIFSWTKIVLAAGPALESLAAAGSAVIGSLGGGLLGAGAGLAGIIGTATVGFGGFLGTLVPTISKLKESKTAMDAYSKAIRTYGRESKEAEKAKRIFERTGSQDARQVLGIWGATKRYWRKATRPGQEETTGLIKDLLQRGRQRFLPQFAGISNQSAEAMREGNTAFLDELDQPNLHRNLNILSNTFQDVTPQVGQTMANAARLFTNIAAAARPEVLEFFKWFDRWMRGANQDTSNLDKMDRYFEGWTRDFKVWVNFFKQLGLLAMTFFGTGKKDGNAMVNELSVNMRKLRQEWEQNPKGLESWFDKQTDNFKKLVREIGALVKALGELVDMLSETIGPITEVSKTVREGLGGGLLGTVGSVATLAGGGLLIRGAGRTLGRAGAGALGRRLPGKLGEYFARKAASGGVVATAEELGGAAAGGAAAARGPGLAARALSRFGPGAARIGAGVTGGYLLATAGLKGLEALGVGDPTEGQGIFTSLTHGFATGDGSDEMISPKERFLMELGVNPKAIDRLNPERSQLFNIYGKKFGDVKSFEKALDPTTAMLKKAGPKGVDIIASNALMWANAQRRNNPKLEGAYDELVEQIKNRYSSLGKHISIVNGEIFTGSQKEWGDIRKAMSSNVEQALEEVTKGFTAIQRQAIGSLMGMGFTHDQAAKLVKESEAGGATGRIARANMNAGPVLGGNAFTTPHEKKESGYHGGPTRAGGGLIPGWGLQDTVNMGGARVAPGEALIATRHQRREIDNMLPPGVSTLGIISGNKRWHSSPMQMPYGGRYAGGGIVSVGRWAQGFGLSVSGGPGYGGIPSSGHAPNSLHYSGLAYDVSGAPALMMKFRQMAEQKYLGHGLNELFYDPYSYYIDQGQKVPGQIGGHSDHVHIGFFPGGPSGATAVRGLMGQMGGLGKAAVHLKAPQTRQRGVPGALAQKAMDAMTAGAQARINKKIGLQARGAGRLQGPLPKVGGSRSEVERAIAMELFRHGANKIGAAGIIGNAWRESGMVPTAEGTGGGGLWGFTAGAISLANLKKAGGQNWGNPVFQTRFMLSHGGQGLIPSLNRAGSPENAARIFMEQWERPGIPALEDREAGARVAFRQGFQGGGPMDFAGWMKDGGSFTVKRPTLFGAGEDGEEDVHVVPKDSKLVSGRSRVVHRNGPVVHIAKIENHRPGDIRKHIEEEFALLGIALDSVIEDEDEVSS